MLRAKRSSDASAGSELAAALAGAALAGAALAAAGSGGVAAGAAQVGALRKSSAEAKTLFDMATGLPRIDDARASASFGLRSESGYGSAFPKFSRTRRA